MAAVAFDSLHHAHQLEAAGMPREQAELVAQGLSAMFVHNFDALVTKNGPGVRSRIDAFYCTRPTILDLTPRPPSKPAAPNALPARL
jgi:hypothetical protein